MQLLFDLGWEPFFSQQLDEAADAGAIAARIVMEQKNIYRLAGESGEFPAVLSGRLRHDGPARVGRPAVGDWVLAAHSTDEGPAVIQRILERKSVIARDRADSNRWRAGDPERQVLAANVDTVFIVESLTGAFSLNRIERYLTLIHDGGAWPVILLTKADLVEDIGPLLAESARRLPMVAAVPVSGLTGQGIDRLPEYLGPGRTAVLLGPSGAGKSTIINRLLGAGLQATAPIRAADDKGRHTTTARQMFRLPDGGLVIDTPGLRAVGLPDDESGLRIAFEDIRRLAEECRFRDCRHVSEPGCAVRRAVEDGLLDRDRYENYLTLQHEADSRRLRGDPDALKKEHRRMARMIAEVKNTDKRKFGP